MNDTPPEKCEKCGGQVVERTGKFGQFYACVNFKSRGCRFIWKPPAKQDKILELLERIARKIGA